MNCSEEWQPVFTTVRSESLFCHRLFTQSSGAGIVHVLVLFMHIAWGCSCSSLTHIQGYVNRVLIISNVLCLNMENKWAKPQAQGLAFLNWSGYIRAQLRKKSDVLWEENWGRTWELVRLEEKLLPASPLILVNWSMCWLDCSTTQTSCFMRAVFQCNLPNVLILISVLTDSFLLLQFLVSVRAPKSSYQVVKESATDVQVLPNHSTPQKTDSYFNPKMKLNRWENREWEDASEGWGVCSEEYVLKSSPVKLLFRGQEKVFPSENSPW